MTRRPSWRPSPSPTPRCRPLEQIAGSLDAFLRWIEANGDAYAKLVRSAAAIPEVREVVDGVRDATAERILEGIAPGQSPPAQLRTAVRAWLWFMDGAILDWIEHGDIKRKKLAQAAAGHPRRRHHRRGRGRATRPQVGR